MATPAAATVQQPSGEAEMVEVINASDVICQSKPQCSQSMLLCREMMREDGVTTTRRTRQRGSNGGWTRIDPAERRHAGTGIVKDGRRVSSEISMCHWWSGGLRIEFPGGNRNASHEPREANFLL